MKLKVGDVIKGLGWKVTDFSRDETRVFINDEEGFSFSIEEITIIAEKFELEEPKVVMGSVVSCGGGYLSIKCHAPESWVAKDVKVEVVK